MKIVHELKKCDNTMVLEREIDQNKLTSEDRESIFADRETQKFKKERMKWDRYYETKIKNEKDGEQPFKQRDSEIIRPKSR